jgi:hypothetical protein
MSFANPLLRRLEKDPKMQCYNVNLIGERPGDILYTEIGMNQENVEQKLVHSRGMSVPDEIQLGPIRTHSVKITTDRGYTFTVLNEQDVMVTHDARKFPHNPEDEDNVRRIVKDADFTLVKYLMVGSEEP